MPTVREFFVSEATDYVEQLDALLQAGQSGEIDGPELQRLGKALRGSALLAREDNVQRLAATLEAAGRGVASGTIVWGEAFTTAATRTERIIRRIVSGEDRDPERLVRDVLEDWRELGIVATETRGSAPESPARLREFRAYAARETGAILQELNAALAALPRDPTDRDPLKSLLRRQRALLGAKQLEAVPVVAETLKTIDDVSRLVARLNVPVLGEWSELYRLARDVLASSVAPLQRLEDPPATPALAGLRQIRDEILERHGDAAPAAAPASSAPQPADVMAMFRREAVELLARIERMAGELAAAPGHRQPEVRRELRTAMAAVRDTARTFGVPEAADAANRGIERAAAGGAVEVLAVVSDLREIITGDDGAPEEAGTAPARPAAGANLAAPAVATPPRPVQASATAVSTHPAPAIGGAPVPGPVVPIESLLYRGDAALRRALELQPQIERALAGNDAALDALAEVFDLIRLGLE
jgi:hypothetical protein